MERSSSSSDERQDRIESPEAISINIPMLDGVYISEMRKMKPRRLRESAGGDICCISRVPQRLIDEAKEEAYVPRIVSIGPYHRDLDKTKMIEEHKWRYLDSLLGRLERGPGCISFNYLYQQMAQIEEYARKCYAEETSLTSHEFVMMMLLDGCFIVELLCRYNDAIVLDEEDPIFNCPWILPLILRDLIKLENQLPFFVLQLIFDVTTLKSFVGSSLSALALKFLSLGIHRPPKVIERYETDRGLIILNERVEIDVGRLHLLDLLRETFIPLQAERPREKSSADVIHCAARLVKAGIKFKQVDQAESFLEISFKNGELKIPRFTIDDFHASFLTNCVAFEQTYRYISWYFTAYVTFMDRLVDTERDVGLLIDNNIMSNFLGNEKEVAKFYNDIGRDVIIDIKRCYLSKQFEEICKYYADTKHVRYEEFKSRYFSSPWSFMSASAALALLFLAMAQTICSILSVIGV